MTPSSPREVVHPGEIAFDQRRLPALLSRSMEREGFVALETNSNWPGPAVFQGTKTRGKGGLGSPRASPECDPRPTK